MFPQCINCEKIEMKIDPLDGTTYYICHEDNSMVSPWADGCEKYFSQAPSFSCTFEHDFTEKELQTILPGWYGTTLDTNVLL